MIIDIVLSFQPLVEHQKGRNWLNELIARTDLIPNLCISQLKPRPPEPRDIAGV